MAERDYKHQTSPTRTTEERVGVDLFDDERPGMITVYVRYADGKRSPARDVTEDSPQAQSIIKAWCESYGPVNDYRTDTKTVTVPGNHRIEVIVGNIGTVYSGNNPVEAERLFEEYVQQSKSERGRAGGEDVTIMTDGEPSKEFKGSLPD